MTDDDPTPRKCGARKRSNGTCTLTAGWGTTHPGYGQCKLHGGAMRNNIKNAEKQQAQVQLLTAVDRYGLSREVDPATALLEEVHRSAGIVAYLAAIVTALDREDLTETSIAGPQPVVWIRMLKDERKHLAMVARSAIDAGIAERQVRMWEALGNQLVAVLRVIVTKLGHDPDAPQVREIVSDALRAIA